MLDKKLLQFLFFWSCLLASLLGFLSFLGHSLFLFQLIIVLFYVGLFRYRLFVTKRSTSLEQLNVCRQLDSFAN